MTRACSSRAAVARPGARVVVVRGVVVVVVPALDEGLRWSSMSTDAVTAPAAMTPIAAPRRSNVLRSSGGVATTGSRYSRVLLTPRCSRPTNALGSCDAWCVSV